MTQIWTPEQRLDAINKLAYLGHTKSSCEYYWLIGMLTTGDTDQLNSSEEIAAALMEVENV